MVLVTGLLKRISAKRHDSSYAVEYNLDLYIWFSNVRPSNKRLLEKLRILCVVSAASLFGILNFNFELMNTSLRFEGIYTLHEGAENLFIQRFITFAKANATQIISGVNSESKKKNSPESGKRIVNTSHSCGGDYSLELRFYLLG